MPLVTLEKRAPSKLRMNKASTEKRSEEEGYNHFKYNTKEISAHNTRSTRSFFSEPSQNYDDSYNDLSRYHALPPSPKKKTRMKRVKTFLLPCGRRSARFYRSAYVLRIVRLRTWAFPRGFHRPRKGKTLCAHKHSKKGGARDYCFEYFYKTRRITIAWSKSASHKTRVVPPE